MLYKISKGSGAAWKESSTSLLPWEKNLIEVRYNKPAIKDRVR